MAVTPAMIATALGVATPAPDSLTYNQWQMWIEDAEFQIDQRRVKLGIDGLDDASVDFVVKQAVVDHAKHPDNATTVTVAVDDGSMSRRYESGQGRVSVDSWWDFLGLADNSTGAFTIRPFGREPECGVAPW